MITKKLNLAVLGSTRGTNLLPLIAASRDETLSATIQMVLSNKSDALILTRAHQHNIPAQFVTAANLTRETYDAKLLQLLKNKNIDLLVLIGYMRILSAEFVQAYPDKIINVHPSLLPKHAGKMDLAVHQAVLDAHDRETGCSVHFVTEQVDAGPIILQRHCNVYEDDTAMTLKARVQMLEGGALIAAINQLANDM